MGKERTRHFWGEWIRNRAAISQEKYGELARGFNPVEFKPEDWAGVFRDAGAKYVVLTAKHHEGFAMYHSQASKFNSYDWPANYHGEPVKELGDAVRSAGLKFGVYYSQKVDWFHFGKVYSNFNDYFEKVCVPQVTELVKGYGPLAILWFDIGLGERAQAERLKAVVRQYQPEALISPRIGAIPGDYSGGGDNEVPPTPRAAPWESCMTLTQHWAGYPQDVTQRSAAEVIRVLADIRSKGGNMLLDIGPDDKGNLAPRDVLILRRAGAWLRKFGVSIYGVKASPLSRVPWGCVTAGGDSVLYLHVFEIPPRGGVLLPGVKGAIEKAWLLGDPEEKALPVKAEGERDWWIGLDVKSAPAEALNADDTVVAVKLAPGAELGADYLVDDDVRNEFDPVAAKRTGKAAYRHLRLTYTTAEEPAVEIARYDSEGTVPTPDSSLDWTFRAILPGDYHVIVDYACVAPAGCKAVVRIDAETFPLNATPTPDDREHRFRTVRLGTVAIRNEGAHLLTLAPEGGAEHLVINKITLLPTRTTPLNASVDAEGHPFAAPPAAKK